MQGTVGNPKPLNPKVICGDVNVLESWAKV